MKHCPPSQHLEEFLEDRLPAAERETIAAHVEACEHCQSALENLTNPVNGEQLTASTPAAVEQSSTAHHSTTAAPHLPSAQAAFLVQLKEDASFRWLASGKNGSQAAPATGEGVKFPAVANYEILAELGRGGMGVVYKARQLSLNRLVALKMILAGSHAGARDLDRFRREAEAVARLRHPNIIQIYDIGEAEGRPFFALEFVDGASLAQLLRGTPQPASPAARFAETLARAVHYAHQQGIIHRDLKPANVLLPASDCGLPVDPATPNDINLTIRNLQSATPKITDFGLAMNVDAQVNGSPSEEVAGTPSYMAPEQAVPRASGIGPAADIYALGAIFYELLTGRPPFRGPTSLETVVQVMHEEPVRPSYLRPDLPRDLETICLKCLAKEPAKRYSSAEALAEDLYRFRHGKPILARPVGLHERIWKWAKHRPLAAGLLAGMILTAVLGFAGVTWQWQEARLARDDEKEHRESAEKARAFAIKKRKEADNARAEAEKQRQDAIIARNEADTARIKETAERNRARASLYYSRIAQSQFQWRVNDFSSARKSLDKCLPKDGLEDQRGWEWYYLQGLFHSSLFTLNHAHGGLGGSVAFDRHHRWIVSVVSGYPDDETVKNSEIRIWDAKTGDLVQALPVPGTLHRLAIRPDGNQFAFGSTDGSVHIWDMPNPTGTLEHNGANLRRVPVHTQAVSSLAYDPKGGQIASASWDGTVKIWDAASGTVRHTLRGHTDKVQGVAYDPEGKRVASVSWDTTVKIWDPVTGKELKTLRRHKRPVYAVAFSPDGKLLASASRAGTLRLWDLATDGIIQSLTSDTGSVLSIAFSPDGRYVAKAGKDGTVRVVDLEIGSERVAFRGHAYPVEGVDFSSDGRRLVSISPARGYVKVWDLTRHPEYATFARSDSDLEAIVFHEDGKRLASINMAGKLQFWDVHNGLLLEEQVLPLSRQSVRPGMPASFSPGGRLLAGCCQEDVRTVKLWDTATGLEKAAFRALPGPVQCVRFSPDGRYLAICAGDLKGIEEPHEISVWEVASKKRVAGFTGHGRIFTVAFSSKGTRLAWGDDDRSFSLVDWSSKEPPRTIRAHKTAVGALAFSHDDTLLASAGLEDRTVRIWKVDKLLSGTWKALRVLPAPVFLSDLAFSPDDRRLAGISLDLVKMWEVESGNELLTLRGAAQRYWDPPFNPRLAFSRDGFRLAGTNWDESVSIWDAPLQNNPKETEQLERRRREVADQRTAFWHLQEAEQCLEHKNVPAAAFHVQRLGNAALPEPLQARKNRLVAKLAGG